MQEVCLTLAFVVAVLREKTLQLGPATPCSPTVDPRWLSKQQQKHGYFWHLQAEYWTQVSKSQFYGYLVVLVPILSRLFTSPKVLTIFQMFNSVPPSRFCCHFNCQKAY